MRVPRTVMAVGGVVVAAAAIGFMDPKAVHAVTAALVQVTNTAENPVAGAEVTRTASQLIELSCPATERIETCQAIGPGGTLNGTYTVPSFHLLVITNVEAQSGVSGITILAESAGINGAAYHTFTFANDGSTHELNLSSGFVWPAAGSVSEISSSVGAPVILRGYLTNN